PQNRRAVHHEQDRQGTVRPAVGPQGRRLRPRVHEGPGGPPREIGRLPEGQRRVRRRPCPRLRPENAQGRPDPPEARPGASEEPQVGGEAEIRKPKTESRKHETTTARDPNTKIRNPK